MKNLQAFVTAPFATANGEIVCAPGYHDATQTYAHFDADQFADMPTAPHRPQIVQAIKQLWRPWCAYKFSTEHDKAGMLASIIGGVCRPGLDLCPGALFDAPAAGSGKSKAAGALGAVIMGRRCPAVIGARLNDDDEMRKLIVSSVIAGDDVLFFDNLRGGIASAAMEGAITAGWVMGRVLGSSLNFNGACRLMFMLSSNNASLNRDLARRFVRCRIDHGVESPQALRFPFDPVERALAERLAIVRGVLTLIAGFFAAGAPNLSDGDAGFAQWNRLVRNCVLWANGEGLLEEAEMGRVGDPAYFIQEEAGRFDPESSGLAMLLRGLRGKFGEDYFYAREVEDWLSGGAAGEAASLVREGVETIQGAARKPTYTAASLANTFKYKIDCPADGLKLVKGRGEHKTMVFAVLNA